MAPFIDVAALSELPEQEPHAVTLPDGTPVVLVRRGSEVSAFLDECPHQGMLLSAGEVMPDGTLECPWHGARFDCRTGEVRRGPAEDNATAFEVRIVDQRVLVAGVTRQ